MCRGRMQSVGVNSALKCNLEQVRRLPNRSRGEIDVGFVDLVLHRLPICRNRSFETRCK